MVMMDAVVRRDGDVMNAEDVFDVIPHNLSFELIAELVLLCQCISRIQGLRKSGLLSDDAPRRRQFCCQSFAVPTKLSAASLIFDTRSGELWLIIASQTKLLRPRG
jgi:hypothetical protein